MNPEHEDTIRELPAMKALLARTIAALGALLAELDEAANSSLAWNAAIEKVEQERDDALALAARLREALERVLGSIAELHMDSREHDETRCEACAGEHGAVTALGTYELAKQFFPSLKPTPAVKALLKQGVGVPLDRPLEESLGILKDEP